MDKEKDKAKDRVKDKEKDKIKIIPLGGLNEIGKKFNCYRIQK